MPDGLEDYRDLAARAAETARAELRHAFNNSMAGRETGRIDVAFVGENSRTAEAEKRRKKRAERILETTLQSLLTDPVYRKRWEEFGTFLKTYATAEQTALERAIEASNLAHHAVRQALEDAHTLDGKAVFETDDGRYVYRNGTEVDPNQADRIVRSKEAISYADFLLLEEAARSSDRAVADIRTYQDKLDAVKAKRTNPDNPYKSIEEMGAEQERLERDAPQSVKNAIEASADQTMQRVPTGEINL